MIEFNFTKSAEKSFRVLDEKVQSRIIRKLQILKDVQLFESSLKNVYNLKPATHRLRVGNYRLLVEYDKIQSKCLILAVGHRNSIYTDS